MSTPFRQSQAASCLSLSSTDFADLESKFLFSLILFPAPGLSLSLQSQFIHSSGESTLDFEFSRVSITCVLFRVLLSIPLRIFFYWPLLPIRILVSDFHVAVIIRWRNLFIFPSVIFFEFAFPFPNLVRLLFVCAARTLFFIDLSCTLITLEFLARFPSCVSPCESFPTDLLWRKHFELTHAESNSIDL